MRLGLGNFNTDDTGNAVQDVKSQLLYLDAALGRALSCRPIKGTVAGATNVVVPHTLGIKPQEVIVVPDAASIPYVTAADRKNWNDRQVVISFSAACSFTGYVVSFTG